MDARALGAVRCCIDGTAFGGWVYEATAGSSHPVQQVQREENCREDIHILARLALGEFGVHDSPCP
jgi:hypothetical protein